MRWKIEEYNSDELLGAYFLPGRIRPAAVAEVLRQLAARHLCPEEIVSAHLRKGTRGRSTLLDVKTSNGILQIGENPFLVARKVSE